MKNLNFLLFVFILLCTDRLNAQHWDTVGAGAKWGIEVKCLYTDTTDNKLYAAGQYTKMGGIWGFGIAKWDGSRWDSVGMGANRAFNPALTLADDTTYPACAIPPGRLYAVTRYKSELYLGGAFGYMGKRNYYTQGIAKWDGKNYGYAGNVKFKRLHTPAQDSLLFDDTGVIYNFHDYQDTLYALGQFDSIGGKAIQSIAKTVDGKNWYPVMPKVQNYNALPVTWAGISAIAFYKGEVYVGGNWGHDSNRVSNIDDILRWDGKQLKPLGNGLSSYNTVVTALCEYKGELYVGGFFLKAYGDPGDFIAKWDGTQWSEVGGGVQNGQVWSLYVWNNELYVGGAFHSAGNLPNTAHIAKWDGTQWKALENNKQSLKFRNGTAIATTIAAYKGQLYIGGGNIDSINGVACGQIARYTAPAAAIAPVASSKELFFIYPNPASQSSTLTYELLQAQTASVSITDLTGRVLQTYILPASQKGELILDATQYPQGLYFCTLLVQGQPQQVLKWVVNK